MSERLRWMEQTYKDWFRWPCGFPRGIHQVEELLNLFGPVLLPQTWDTLGLAVFQEQNYRWFCFGATH